MEMKSQQLQELRDQALEIVDQMEELLRGEDMIGQRAESYWLPQLKIALTKEHMYLGGSMVDCEDTIRELQEKENPSEPKFDVDMVVKVAGVGVGDIIDMDRQTNDYSDLFEYQVEIGDTTDWYTEDELTAV